jgi:hypothetical protein
MAECHMTLALLFHAPSAGDSCQEKVEIFQGQGNYGDNEPRSAWAKGLLGVKPCRPVFFHSNGS